MADRVAVLVDYQNAHNEAKRQFHPYGVDPAVGHFHPWALGELIAKRRSRQSVLGEVRVYRGRPNPGRQPGATRANELQSNAWRAAGVTVIRRNLKYPSDWPDQPAIEKGIDVALAVDAIRLGMRQDYDVVVLFTSDNDILPAVEALHELRLCHVEVATWERANRLRIDGTQLPWCHYIREAEYRVIEDPTDYAAIH